MSSIENILINPNFIKHLNDKQFKLIGAIILCNQQKKQFGLREISFYSGLTNLETIEKIKKSLVEIKLLNENWELDVSSWEKRIGR
ncbi:hypothetical protein [Aliarcobacter thereius]|uniref:hypothetical protein n=1 Tax=Aliarcobacter thereius TaxID=544718 RepID=UPI0008265C61|nr:hypothetical protein [Aliarcobacter thereius]OCL90604.1 hypothetical protein AAX25_01702 [Aliarcobacter thereius]